MYQGLVFFLPVVVLKIPALGTKLYSVVILLVLILGRHNIAVTFLLVRHNTKKYWCPVNASNSVNIKMFEWYKPHSLDDSHEPTVADRRVKQRG